MLSPPGGVCPMSRAARVWGGGAQAGRPPFPSKGPEWGGTWLCSLPLPVPETLPFLEATPRVTKPFGGKLREEVALCRKPGLRPPPWDRGSCALLRPSPWQTMLLSGLCSFGESLRRE